MIDGYKGPAVLEQLGRDTVEATLWEMGEAEAPVLSRSPRFGPQESALEQGWLLAEMEQRFGYGHATGISSIAPRLQSQVGSDHSWREPLLGANLTITR